MNADQKQRFLDWLLDAPQERRVADVPASDRARRLLFDAGLSDRSLPKASAIWERHTFAVEAKKASIGQLLMPVPKKIFAVGAVAAAVLVSILLLSKWQNPAHQGGITDVATSFSKTYGAAVQVYADRAVNYTAVEKDNALLISADTLMARIDFKASAAIRTVFIQTPFARFQIVGTSITLKVTPQKTELYVAEGKVRVAFGGKEDFITQGKVWSADFAFATQREATGAEMNTYLQLGHGTPLPVYEQKKEPRAERPGRQNEKPEGEKIHSPAKGNDTTPREEKPEPRARLEKENRQEERSEREARRSDRETRRAERQARRAEKLK